MKLENYTQTQKRWTNLEITNSFWFEHEVSLRLSRALDKFSFKFPSSARFKLYQCEIDTNEIFKFLFTEHLNQDIKSDYVIKE